MNFPHLTRIVLQVLMYLQVEFVTATASRGRGAVGSAGAAGPALPMSIASAVAAAQAAAARINASVPLHK